jgi:hypothetical protein
MARFYFRTDNLPADQAAQLIDLESSMSALQAGALLDLKNLNVNITRGLKSATTYVSSKMHAFNLNPLMELLDTKGLDLVSASILMGGAQVCMGKRKA